MRLISITFSFGSLLTSTFSKFQYPILSACASPTLENSARPWIDLNFMPIEEAEHPLIDHPPSSAGQPGHDVSHLSKIDRVEQPGAHSSWEHYSLAHSSNLPHSNDGRLPQLETATAESHFYPLASTSSSGDEKSFAARASVSKILKSQILQSPSKEIPGLEILMKPNHEQAHLKNQEGDYSSLKPVNIVPIKVEPQEYAPIRSPPPFITMKSDQASAESIIQVDNKSGMKAPSEVKRKGGEPKHHSLSRQCGVRRCERQKQLKKSAELRNFREIQKTQKNNQEIGADVSFVINQGSSDRPLNEDE